jgi:hypothetical protein
MTLDEQIQQDIENQNFKRYKTPDGGYTWVPASKPPSEGWIEEPEDPNELPDPNFTPSWISRRQVMYPEIREQLNVLFDDIKSGKFGEAAKTSQWATMIQSIKDAVPKYNT